jgi:hypothetical protein
MPRDQAFEDTLFERLDALDETVDAQIQALHIVIAALHQISTQLDAWRKTGLIGFPSSSCLIFMTTTP